ncbi:MAG: DUF4175 family protein [Bacteroidota bacterium]
MADSYQNLIEKLDAFIRRYYLNEMIRGGLYFVGIGLSALLVVAILEYFGRFSGSVRAVLFFGLLAVFLFLLVRNIILPGLKLFRLGSVISHEKASEIIGKHFPEVSDKLLNTLQLHQQASKESADNSLLIASIEQKTIELKPVPFQSAINFADNKKYLKYVLPPLGLALLLLVISPSVLTESTQRIVTYNQDYTPQAPFEFLVMNESLSIPGNEDFTLEANIDGEYVPQSVKIDLGGKAFRLNNEGGGKFSYTFRNVRNDIPFKFFADGFYSEDFVIKVLPPPVVRQMKIDVSYPDYLKMDAASFINRGNIQVPEGSQVAWLFKTENTEELFLSLGDSAVSPEETNDNSFKLSQRLFESTPYSISAYNKLAGNADTVTYRIDVVKDAYPKINVEETSDTLDSRRLFFGGSISDDYGLSSLVFHYKTTNPDGSEERFKEYITINSSETQEFFHFQDFSDLVSEAGQAVEYYFEVWDNDGINGSKSARSVKKTYEAPTEKELDEERKKTSENIKDQLEENIEMAAELQKELEELNKELLKDKELDWQDKKRVEDLLEKQKKLEKNIESMRNERKQMQQKQENFLEKNEQILEKQRQLEKMFDELMSEEMKEMYRRMEELMQELDQEKLMEQLEQMELSAEELEKELDRNLEMFKQFEVEQEFERSVEKLKDLAEKQEELSERSTDKDEDTEKLKEEQDKLNEEFEELKEELDELEKKNEELEQPFDLPSTDEQEESIDEKMEDSSEKLDEGKGKKASESQQGASDEMQDMANQMEAAMQSAQSQQAQENMEDLRALLENIIQLSFDQEGVMEELKPLERDDPAYVESGRKQRKIKDDSQMVEDSLFALSKRVPQIESIVNEEISAINQNISKALEDIGERRTANATSRQQYVMTSYNNLALLLDEALQQMQQAMANQMPGTGNCENPGGQGKTPSSGKMGKMQEEMGQKLEEMLKQMEKGQQEGGQKPGFKPGMGNQGMSKEIAKMAAEQAAIRREVERMAQELNENGKGEGSGLKDIAEDMEDLEKDLVNQELTRESLKRQEDILIRLLESEKAMREREYDNKRESNSPGSYEPSNPEDYLEYKRKKSKEVELLRTVPADLKPYYRDKVNDYFLNFESNN